MFSIKFKTGKQIFPFFFVKNGLPVRAGSFSLREKNCFVFNMFIAGSGKQLLFRLRLNR